MALENGKSFWCSALGKVNAIERLVKQLAPAGSDTNDPEIIKQAFEDAASRLRSGWKEPPEVHFSSENQRRRVLGKEVTIQENLEGEEVTVWSTGHVYFLWKSWDDRIISFSLPGSKTFIPKVDGAKRFISFTSEGISVLDEFQHVLSPKGQMTTWTKEQLSKMVQADDIEGCWRYHVPGEEWVPELEVVEEEAPDALPKEFYEPVGPGPLHQNQKKNLGLYSKPPRPGDGTWIVHEFLNEFLGDDGGRLFTGNAETFSEFESEHVKVQLRQFIAQPKYQNYPWKSDWRDLANDDESRATGHIRENIKFCREIIRTKQANKTVRIAGGGSKQENGKWWLIGPRREGW